MTNSEEQFEKLRGLGVHLRPSSYGQMTPLKS